MLMRNSDFKLALIVVAALMMLFSAPSFTQDEDDEEDVEVVEKMDWLIWDSVERFTGQATVQQTSWTDRDNGFDKEKNSTNDFSTFHFELVRTSAAFGSSTWIAGKVRVSGNTALSSLDESLNDRLTYSRQAAFDQAIVDNSSKLSLSLNHETGEFEVGLPDRLDTPVPQPWRRSEWKWMEGTDNSEGTDLTDSIASAGFNGNAPRDIGVLHATYNDDYLEEDGRAGSRTIARVVLVPEYSDFKVVVEFDAYNDKGKQVSYEDWRPFGSIKEPGRAGNYINVKAVLHPKRDMKPAVLPKVKYFRFELLNTSHEPGVAMNWPPNAKKDKNPDLRLIVDLASPGLPDKEDKEGQSLVVSRPAKDAEGRSAAMARIDSYDFGGRTELRVIVELEDGRKIIGELESGDLSYNEIRIPKRDFGDWVADVWRIKHDVRNLPDHSDDEAKPKGDGDNGDGLTLYEEYRGFAAKRMQDGRVEGDPMLKDLFILNLVGSDAWPGIHMFEEATGLRAIHRLVEPEIREKDRVVNRNYDKAPHQVDKYGNNRDQHGLVLKTLNFEQMGSHGAEVRGNAASLAGDALRPKTVEVVAMPARDDPEALINKPFNLSADDLAIRYDRTVVHELLHSVGVSHHGSGDTWGDFRYVPVTYRDNHSGSALFYLTEYHPNSDRVRRTAWVDVLEEKTAANKAREISRTFDDKLEQLAAAMVSADNLPAGTGFKDMDKSVQWSLIARLPYFSWGIGVEHGQHSGDEQCPMRYTYAEVYKARGALSLPRETYYLVPKGTEDIGVQICTDDKGTGVNGSGWKPQSRYGTAADNFGKDIKQICVNDAVPIHKKGWRR